MSASEPLGGPAFLAGVASLVLVAGCDASVVSVGAWTPALGAVDAAADASAEATLRDASQEITPPDAPVDEGVPDAPVADACQARDVPRVDGGGGIYLEAESGLLSGFTIGNDPLASGGQFIAPPAGVNLPDTQQGAARAVYQVEITTPGCYLIWGRINSPDTFHNRAWFQVDGGMWRLWRITTGEI
jgi:hypothetical protein